MKKIRLAVISSFLFSFMLVSALNVFAQTAAINASRNVSNVSVPKASAAQDASVPQKVKKQPMREWLVMVYINAKNDLGLLPNAFMSVNDMERIGSTDKVAVVVEYGAFENHGGKSVHSEDSWTLFIKKDEDYHKITSPVLYHTEKADMGSSSHLVNFARRAIDEYPARHTILVVWNHGKGIDGISFDDITGNHISVVELGLALKEISNQLGRKIDMFVMDACLMQSLSIAYQLRDYANIIIGSQETEPINGLPYYWLLGELNKPGRINAKQFCDDLVDAFKKNNPKATEVTMSALNTAAFPRLVSLFDQWINEIRQDKEILHEARSVVHVKDSRNISEYDYRDLLDYVEHLNGSLKPSRAKAAGEMLASFIREKVIISNYSNDNTIKGLSIYIPSGDYYNPDYWELDFPKDSAWSGFNAELAEQM